MSKAHAEIGMRSMMVRAAQDARMAMENRLRETRCPMGRLPDQCAGYQCGSGSECQRGKDSQEIEPVIECPNCHAEFRQFDGAA